MKVSCIALNSNLISKNNQDKIVNFISTKLYEIGENVSLISYFDNNIDKLRNLFLENYDLIFLLGSSSSIYNHNIKENLSRIFGDKLENSEPSYICLKKYCEKHNIVFSVQEEMEVLLPTKSIPLCSEECFYNGFMYKYGNTYVIFLPDDIKFAKNNYYNYILPLISDIAGVKQDYQVLKCFGVLEKDLKTLINEFFSVKDINIQIVNNGLDNTIYIRFNSNIDKLHLQEIVSNICTKLNKFIYSTEDISIYQMACDLLKLHNKTLSIAETLTLGNITKELTMIDNNIVNEAFILNNYEAIKNATRIEQKVIDKFGKYSVNTVYELANCLLGKSNADITIFILGDFLSKDVCYMAIGDIDGIHVYKNRIVNSNDNLIENLSKTSIFYLIKKLRQNSLQNLPNSV